MSIYAISDLHFGEASGKDMDLFGENWVSHKEKIVENWKKVVKDDDIVVIAGDVSWASGLESAKEDLKLVDDLPGIKVIARGNHDYWWKSVTSLNSLYKNMHFVQNDNFFVAENTVICGIRGYICPNEYTFTSEDKKIYKRELARLKITLEAASKKNVESIILLLHYPPTNDKLETSEIVEIIEEYKVKKVIYGHLHGKKYYKDGLQGIHNGTEYILTSSDYLDFMPKKISDN